MSATITSKIPSPDLDEVLGGERCQFGQSWSRFLLRLNEERKAAAAKSLANEIVIPELDGSRILGPDSGSGPFSLAASWSSARVHSSAYGMTPCVTSRRAAAGQACRRPVRSWSASAE